MATDTFTCLDQIELEATRLAKQSGLAPTLVRAVPVYSKDGHSLVLAIQHDTEIVYAPLCDRMHELSFSEFSVGYLQPAVFACKTELEYRFAKANQT